MERRRAPLSLCVSAWSLPSNHFDNGPRVRATAQTFTATRRPANLLKFKTRMDRRFFLAFQLVKNAALWKMGAHENENYSAGEKKVSHEPIIIRSGLRRVVGVYFFYFIICHLVLNFLNFILFSFSISLRTKNI